MNTKRKPRASRGNANLRASSPRPHLVRLTYRYADGDRWKDGEFVVSVNLPNAQMELEQLRPILRPLIDERLNEGDMWDEIDDVYVDWIIEVPQQDAALWTAEHSAHANGKEVNGAYETHCDAHMPGDWPDEDSDETGVVEPLFRLKAH